MFLASTHAAINPTSYTVSLYTATGPSVCGGMLVAPRHILTSAHCISYQPLVYVQIGAEQRRVIQTVVHPQFNTNTRSFNLAVVVLDLPSRQSTVPLRWTDVELKSPSTGDATAAWVPRGSGSALESGLVMAKCSLTFPDPSILCARSSVIGATCGADAGKPIMVENQVHTILCPGPGMVATCGEDSGKPLVVNDLVVGVAGVGCTANSAAGNGATSMFASVSKAQSFIEPYLQPVANADPTRPPRPTSDDDNEYIRPSRDPIFA
ncbi:hypothetical protein H257_12652 [Aphanomyces astaci]|uniref:Peptidase S1 domain-containing protein n=2 Tax=Aphanomyces astaci TaxID=112090 RepID=W4FYW5_APHAT|nr:hypothetical protein H257_12652 [Aphanomyces astaci]ETV72176.1 hypothetical protein H257_12652 [Aphanomyces astaci]|eukprot:XP_009838244.1 hypothetical protein H257_12652 [Aphanomyces astaci]